MPAHEVRDRMLAAAHRSLTDAGLAVSADHLLFEDVIVAAGVSRSAAYRLWPSRELFYRDLVIRLAGPDWAGDGPFDQESIDLAERLVTERLGDLRTPNGRRRLLRDVVRTVVSHNFTAIRASRAWHNVMAIQATLVSMSSEERSDLLEALRTSDRQFTAPVVELFRDLALMLGLRLRPPYDDFGAVVVMGAAVLEGLTMRALVNAEVIDRTVRVLADDGTEEEWSIAALAYFAVIDAAVEPDPAYDFDGAVATYLGHVDAIRVAIADPHEIVRAGLADAIARHDDLRLAASVSTPEELLESYVEADAVLLDGPIEAIRPLAQRFGRVLYFTSESRPVPLRRAMAEGASGVVRKSDPGAAVVDALRSSGETWISASLAGAGLDGDPGLAELSPAQVAVLRALAEGLDRARTARLLGISEATVMTYLHRIRERFRSVGIEANNTMDLVRLAREQGDLD